MSESRSSSKRSRESSESQQPSALSKRTRMMDLFSQQQIETLQAELEHERSKRALDQQRFEQHKKRLEKQLELAVEQAQQAQANLIQVQEESERMVEEVRLARNSALEQLRNCQMELHDRTCEQPDVAVYEQKCRLLEQRIATFENEEMKWKEDLHKLQTQLAQDIQARAVATPQKTPAILEDAPPAVMKELCRVRTQLADSERKERQAQRIIEDLERRNKTLLQEREETRTMSRRIVHLEKELKDTRSKYETIVAQGTSWQQFERQIAALLKRQDIALCHEGGPPELATVVRFMDQAQSESESTKKELSRRIDEFTQLKGQYDDAKGRLMELEALCERQKADKRILEMELDNAQRKQTELDATVTIYRAETENLRALIKTFEDMPLVPSNGTAGDALSSSTSLSTSISTMEVRLNALQQELDASKEDRNRLAMLLEKATKSAQDDALELVRVREKFEKLKVALFEERAKVETAEARANQAEALAGKGSFNPETTRVLRMKESPLTEALKEEIKVLRRQLEVIGEKAPAKPALDPEKLHQRLKESFKEQIALFREGVYLMTGLKVDMLTPTDGLTTFRVRSIYAEREHDHLMLRRPAGDGSVKSLDILSTDFAKELFSLPHCYQYMTKFHSLPAFMASVQLALFEKQTVMM